MYVYKSILYENRILARAGVAVPSIVVHKGGRSDSRPGSPSTLVCEGGMPSLPASRQQALALGSSSHSDSDMIEANVSNQLHRSASVSSSSPHNPTDTEIKNYRNKPNTKLKLLQRSHAMRESTSPPRDPQNGSASSSPGSPKSAEPESTIKVTSPSDPNSRNPSPLGNKKSASHSPSPNRSAAKSQQFNNNNEPISNSNLSPVPNQSPKRTRNSATSPTCRTPTRNGSASPSQAHPKQQHPVSPVNANNKSEGRLKQQHSGDSNSGSNKCNNCVKGNNGPRERPVLLQTPVSPSKGSHKNAQNNQHNKSDQQRRPNSLNVCSNQCNQQCGNNTLSVNRSNARHKLRHNSSSQGSYDSGLSTSLSRDSSTELYTDSTGVDLEQFIAETINRNQKDRTVLLKIEKDLIDFAKDRQKVSHKFPNMSSYNRMLVHRVAAYFGMEHNVDQSGLSVIVTRTKNMRIPDTKFKEHIRDDLILAEEPRRSILKRDSSSFEDSFNFKSPDRMSGEYCRRSKSFEEREEEYERARRRIFKDSSGESGDVTSWPYWSSSESSDASARYRLLHPSDHSIRNTRLMKGESLDDRDSYRPNSLRPSVSKSFSFGGYTRGMLSRGDSVMSTHSAGARLVKQDSGASMCSRLSPSSSGYKSQSQRSDVTLSPSPSPSPNMSCNHSQLSSQDVVSPEPNGQTVMWAVTSISSVPPGSVIINPQTNQPYTNPDGSLYRFDPDNPPKFFIEDVDSPGPKHSEFSNKQRGMTGGRYESDKRHRSQTTKHGGNCNSGPAIQPQPPQGPPPMHPSAAPTSVPGSQPCGHGQPVQPYATYIPTSEPFSQGVYPASVGQQTVMMAPHPGQVQQPNVQAAPGQDEIFGQNPAYANYAMPVQPPPLPAPQPRDVTELSNYFMGMNVYDQRVACDNQSTPQNPYSQPPPPANQSLPNVQPNYWQTPANQVPPQQTMYFVPPPGAAMSVNQNPNDRTPISQQQRFPPNYSMQTITSPTQASGDIANYMGGYPVTYNSMPTVTSTTGDYGCQPPVHVLPAYYPGQTGMQGPPVVYRVPTPPSTPTSSQMPGMPLMYVNSGNYPPPTMMPNGTFGQVGGNGSPPAPPGAYMAPALIPNIVFRQNVPLVTGVRTSTPGSSQRASRSPTPAHELFGGANNGDRNSQAPPPPRYPLPMYQGVQIVQGDMRLMHARVPGNSRLQYAPVQSPTIMQGCPRPYRPSSFSSNASGGSTSAPFDGRNPKFRKPRPKITTAPTNSRPNMYQSPQMSSISPSSPKDMGEGTVKVTINRRSQSLQY
ncbi:hypothetical protein QAD02_015362 [Eretmocerus hayati]|uniref:Uncharacterized protein n=1 Tax=Eretmocerus hayati TaxID=131215 RepID=A0ACC2PCS1_9HYME|nr:hypothetical protein QAD02_015362 [Eretmocerus hayati]